MMPDNKPTVSKLPLSPKITRKDPSQSRPMTIGGIRPPAPAKEADSSAPATEDRLAKFIRESSEIARKAGVRELKQIPEALVIASPSGRQFQQSKQPPGQRQPEPPPQ